jgi:hypothetical protein
LIKVYFISLDSKVDRVKRDRRLAEAGKVIWYDVMGRREKAFQLTRGAPFDLTHSEDWHERPPPPPPTLSVVFPNPF